MSEQEFYQLLQLTAKMAGNSGCVGTKYFGGIRFAGLLININPLLKQWERYFKEHRANFLAKLDWI